MCGIVSSLGVPLGEHLGNRWERWWQKYAVLGSSVSVNLCPVPARMSILCPSVRSGYKVFSLQTKLILRIYLRNYFLLLSLFSSGQFQISLAELFSSILGNENIFLLRRKFQKLQLSYHTTEILHLLEVFSNKFSRP